MTAPVANDSRTVEAPPLQTTVFETDAQLKKHLDRTPASIKQLIVRFGIGAVAALTLVSMFTAFASRRVGTDQAIEDARNAALYIAKRRHRDQRLRRVARASDSVARDATSVSSTSRSSRPVLSDSLVRVKLWAARRQDHLLRRGAPHRAVYELDDDKKRMFDNNEQAAKRRSATSRRRRTSMKPFNKLLEVYQLTETTGHKPVVFEAYYTYSGVTAVGRDLWKQFAPIAIGSLIALELIQVPIFITLAGGACCPTPAGTPVASCNPASSRRERRRIASDLHDGVVQELTGVSLSLAAASRSDSADAPKMGEASSASAAASSRCVRCSSRSIRPNLHEEGLEFALGDLLGGVSNRGILRQARCRSGKAQLSAEPSASYLGRCEEALRNVVSHWARPACGWSRPAATCQGRRGRADGRGFTPRRRSSAQRRDGHFGLRALPVSSPKPAGRCRCCPPPEPARGRSQLPVLIRSGSLIRRRSSMTT